jgi:hypothetical protein
LPPHLYCPTQPTTYSLYLTPYSPYFPAACISLAFVQIIFDRWLKRTIFLGKEKGKRKKGNEYKVAFQQIQVQPCSITLSYMSHNIALQGLPSGAFILLCITRSEFHGVFFHAIKNDLHT